MDKFTQLGGATPDSLKMRGARKRYNLAKLNYWVKDKRCDKTYDSMQN